MDLARKARARDTAEGDAFRELTTSRATFLEAITDMGDTLAHHDLTDDECRQRAGGNPARLQQLYTKRIVATHALNALIGLLADFAHKPTTLTAREAAIGAALNLETLTWMDGRIQELLQRRASEAGDWAKHRAELAADLRQQDELDRRAA